MPEVHVSRFGVIPKSNQPGKLRLIVDLSYPDGRSVNDGIDSELRSLQYINMVHQLLKLGPGAELAKLDIKCAYKIVPVHPQDRYLLGMQWNGQVYVNAALPFGLRPAPKTFNTIQIGAVGNRESRGATHVALPRRLHHVRRSRHRSLLDVFTDTYRGV